MHNSIVGVKSTEWYTEYGNDHDVVLSSRIRLSRNMSEFCFPNTLDEKEREEANGRIIQVFSEIENADHYLVLSMKDITTEEKLLLLEKGLLTYNFLGQDRASFLLRDDAKVGIMLQESDHIKAIGIFAGMELNRLYNEIEHLDNQLEEKLNFAVSMDLGYLSSDISNLGTGMRCSLMLHLPGLSAIGFLDSIIQALIPEEYSLRYFFPEDYADFSLGDMYLLSNRVSLGLGEREIIKKLEDLGRQLVHYEREARKELLEKKENAITKNLEDAYLALVNADELSTKEGIELLSKLRLGSALGIVEDIPLAEITALLFLIQEGHLYTVLEQEKKRNLDKHNLEHERAKFIRKSLSKIMC